MPDEMMDGGAAPSANVDAASQSATQSSATGAASGAEDYSDLAGDPRVQKYVSDLHSKALKDIPKEYRDARKFKELLSHSQILQELQGNPHFQAFMAGQRAGSGQPIPQKPQGTPFRDLLIPLDKQFQLGERGLDLFGGFAEALSKHVMEEIAKQHINPIREYLAGQNIDREYSEASKLERFTELQPQIQQILQKYGNQLSFTDAYKIALHDNPAKAAAMAAAAAGDEEDAEREQKLQRAKAGERPTGHGTGEVSLKKAKSRSESRSNAAKRLASLGVDVNQE